MCARLPLLSMLMLAMACGSRPASDEVCGNGQDDDRDGLPDCADPECAGTCPEDCGVPGDEDDDGLVDCADPDCVGACDGDGDGHLAEAMGGADCDDSRADVHPGAEEVCDDADNDCDGLIDDDDPDLQAWYADDDGDGYGDPDVPLPGACDPAAGASENADDCDDLDPTVHPGAAETCDGRDEDCDGVVDDGLQHETWYADVDGDGYGDAADPGVARCAPATAGESLSNDDCDDLDPTVSPGAAEVCGGGDEDCDGLVDDDDPSLDAASTYVWYADGDGDGYGDGLPTGALACAAPGPDVAPDHMGLDCDDADASVNPAAPEVCEDGVDQDCSGADQVCRTLASGSLADAEVTLLGALAGGSFGHALDGAGDFDGDGVPDLIVGAPTAGVGGPGSGGAWILSGLGLAGTVDASTASTQLEGAASEAAGIDVAGVGDVDGDGLDDVLVGSWNPYAVGSPGKAWLVHGGRSGALSLAWADAILEGSAPGDPAGSVVAGPGDVGGDGVPDLLLGSWTGNRAYLVNGPVSGVVSLAGADAELIGEAIDDQAGADLAGAGDVDGDGVCDILVGAPGESTHGGWAGAAYLLHGPISGAIGLGQADAKLLGESYGDMAGAYVGGGGDLDGDGYDDVLVGAALHDAGGTDAGAVYLVAGPIASPQLDLVAADATIVGLAPGDQLGPVRVGGDLDGDGVDDLIVGAPRASRDQARQGAAYVVPGPVAGAIDLTASVELVGVASEDLAGLAVAAAGDVDRDGFDDVLVGAPWSDAAGAGAGAAWLIFGAPLAP